MENDIENLREFTLNLLQIKGLGPVSFKKLLDEYGDIQKIYKNRNVLFKNYDLDGDNKLLKTIQNKNIHYVCLWEEMYSENLKNIGDPPIVLFYIGNYNKDKIDNSISIVGTRKISSYGKKYSVKFSSDLAQKGYSIISGMAFGVDREVHIATLDSNGYTVAVLASSVDQPTPAYNSDIYRRIIKEGGVIISESLPDTVMNPGLFPNRNRIVAGLSLGTLVVEADEKSGALITANLALDYGREVFSIPGNLDSSASNGTNSLIRDNKAKLVKNVNDILSEFGHNNLKPNKIEIKKNDLSSEEREVYNTILSQPILAQDISLKLSKNIQEILSICSILEIKGYIINNENGKYNII